MQHPQRLLVVTIGSNSEDISTLQESVKHHYQAHASKWQDKEGITDDDFSCPTINIVDIGAVDWTNQLGRMGRIRHQA